MSDPEGPLTAVQVRIYGRVQGVWFRAWTANTATELGLAGWVRNRADGSVEALFAGSRDDVETMVARCHDGPPAARIDEVMRDEPSAQPGPDVGAGFHQLPTL